MTLLIAGLGLVVLLSAWNGRLEYWREVRDYMPEPLYRWIEAEPLNRAIFDLGAYAVCCLLFWHLFIFYLLRYISLVGDGAIKRLLVLTDYAWYTLTVVGILVAVSNLVVRGYDSSLDRMLQEQQESYREAESDFQRARASCWSAPYALIDNDRLSTQNQLLVPKVKTLCSYIESNTLFFSVLDFEFTSSCRQAGFGYADDSESPLPFESASLSSDMIEHFKSVADICGDVLLLAGLRDRIEQTQINQRSFKVIEPDASSRWFLILILVATLRMCKTSADLFLRR